LMENTPDYSLTEITNDNTNTNTNTNNNNKQEQKQWSAGGKGRHAHEVSDYSLGRRYATKRKRRKLLHSCAQYRAAQFSYRSI